MSSKFERGIRKHDAKVDDNISEMPKLYNGMVHYVAGMAVNVISSLMFTTVENRGLFAYTMRGQRLWSAGHVLYRSGYRVGCKRNVTDCHFTSTPVVDQCEDF
ncbi:hypothetical protein MKW98_006453 [Papaver atlanticum]|uniref:Uncharacterized protein n=1 Tax=Papaver atlanticum TaxID=357466 RepID=A0AAD4XET2_9MAGN|nr:hypothetical protein MKW98_006453 [Papaver atlanticum]